MPRFVPTREIDERQRAFHLLDEDERLLHSSHRIIPFESDAARGWWDPGLVYFPRLMSP
jgi:hypothetical protein